MSVNIIDRTDLAGLIPEPVTAEIMQGVVESSAVLRVGRRLANMTSKTQVLNVLDSLPTAYFVNGDAGRKKTAKMAWEKKKIYAEEIAVIVPIPEAVLADASYDIWGEVRPRLIEAFGKVIDGAILFGTNKPDTWRDGLVPSAIEAGAYVTEGSSVFDDIMGVGGVIAQVEENGYIPNNVLSAIKMRAKLRGLKNQSGTPIFMPTLQDAARYALDGIPMDFPKNGAFDTDEALMIVGDFSELVYAIRQDMEFKIFTEGVVQDPATGDIMYNLMQNDMVALRAVMRLGWEIPNPVNAFNDGNASRIPFAIYSPNVLNLACDANIAASTDLFGKVVGDLQSGISIDGNSISGTLKYVTNYTGYSSLDDEKNGNYIALHFSATTGSTIKIKLLGGKSTSEATLDADGLAVLQIGNVNASKPGYDQVIEVTATKGDDTVTRRFHLANLVMENA